MKKEKLVSDVFVGDTIETDGRRAKVLSVPPRIGEDDIQGLDVEVDGKRQHWTFAIDETVTVVDSPHRR